ncbi:MAG TPA: hypothetical protein VIE15_06100, partial [Acidimicrobiales bacterium]
MAVHPLLTGWVSLLWPTDPAPPRSPRGGSVSDGRDGSVSDGRRQVLGAISSGAEDDLRKATELAFDMVAHYGMSERLGPVFYEHRTVHPFLGREIAAESAPSDATVHMIEEEVRRVLAEALQTTRATLTAQRAALEALVAALLEHEMLEKAELIGLLEGHRAGAKPSPAVPPAGATSPVPIDSQKT